MPAARRLKKSGLRPFTRMDGRVLAASGCTGRSTIRRPTIESQFSAIAVMKRLLAILILAVALAACSRNDPDSLVGTWGESFQGQTYPLLKIAKTKGHYVLFTTANGRWIRTSDYVMMASKADLEQIVRHPVQCDVTGLKSGIAAIFKVPEGWTEGTFSTRTGYIAVTWFGPIELVRL